MGHVREFAFFLSVMGSHSRVLNGGVRPLTWKAHSDTKMFTYPNLFLSTGPPESLINQNGIPWETQPSHPFLIIIL